MSRGTRFNRSMNRDQGVLSGTTLGVFPSGSTVTRGGFITDGSYSGTSYFTEPSGVTINNDGIIVTGGVTIGDGGTTDYSVFDSTGKLTNIGEATTWEDLRVPLNTGKTAGANIPTFEVVTGTVMAYNFDDGDEIWFAAQFPHAMKSGVTRIWPHLHWSPESDVSPAENVGIGLEYTIAAINSNFTKTVTTAIDVSTGTSASLKHLINDFDVAGIDVSGISTTVSAMILCRFFRQAAGSNNYSDGIFGIEIDFHYERDMNGSTERTSK